MSGWRRDPFDEIDFGSYFQDYLDPGFRTASNFEEIERPSFENFLSQPSTLTDHLDWQLGSMSLAPEVRLAADLVVGNLNEDGYLTATDEELVDGVSAGARAGACRADSVRARHEGAAAWAGRRVGRGPGAAAGGVRARQLL